MSPDARFIAWRLALLFTGVALLIWLPFEDVQDRLIQFFALLLSGLFALRWLLSRAAQVLLSRLRKPAAVLLFYLLTGLIFGLLVGPFSVLLMALKIGLHAHAAPDFSLYQVWAVLLNAPLWGVIGSLMGLARGLLRLARQEGSHA